MAETLVALKMDPANGLAAAEVAKAYVQSVEGNATGQTGGWIGWLRSRGRRNLFGRVPGVE
jgi:hypothetical protein